MSIVNQFEALESRVANTTHFIDIGKYMVSLPLHKRTFYRFQGDEYVLVEGVLLKDNRLVGGHFSTKITMMKIMHARYYWPTLFTNCHNLVKKC